MVLGFHLLFVVEDDTRTRFLLELVLRLLVLDWLFYWNVNICQQAQIISQLKQWEAVAIHTALKLVRQVRNFVKRCAVLGTTVHNYVF